MCILPHLEELPVHGAASANGGALNSAPDINSVECLQVRCENLIPGSGVGKRVGKEIRNSNAATWLKAKNCPTNPAYMARPLFSMT